MFLGSVMELYFNLQCVQLGSRAEVEFGVTQRRASIKTLFSSLLILLGKYSHIVCT